MVRNTSDWRRYVYFDVDAYLREQLKFQKAYYWRHGRGFSYEIYVDVKGEEEPVSFTVSLDTLLHPTKAQKTFLQFTGHKPIDLPKELWKEVVQEIRKRAERVYDIADYQKLRLP